MDFGDVRNLQFLNLSELDDNERAKLEGFLQLDEPETKFPWFIGQANSGSVKNETEMAPSSKSIHIPPTNSNIYFVPVVNAIVSNSNPIAPIHFPNSPIRAPLGGPAPVFTNYPPPSLQYGEIPVSMYYPVSVNNYIQSPAFPIDTRSPIHQIRPNVPIEQDYNSANGTVEPQNIDTEVSEYCPNVENASNDEGNDAKPSGVGKSWASLFNSNKSAGNFQSNVNGTVKPAFEQSMKENSVNGGAMCPIKNPRKVPFVDPDCYRMGEFLINNAVDGRTNSLQPRGLINQSNYCYINSILQALIACPPVYNLLNGLSQIISSNEKRKPTPVIDGMCRFAKEFNHLPANMRVNNRRSDAGAKNQPKKDSGIAINTDIPFEPSWIYKMLKGIGTDLIEGRQEDAEEFLGCLLNNLNDEMLELIKLVKNETAAMESGKHIHVDNENEDKEWQVMGPKNKGSVTRRTEFDKTPISDIFGGFLRSRIHRTGDHITENIQPFFTLPLNIEKVKTVREALEALTAKNQLEGVTSSRTNEEVEAWQQVMLDELPVVLVLHLKCFDFKLDGCTKIVKALEFPIDLKIDSKLLSSKTNNSKEKQYKLFAVVYHDGKEASKGHYVTDAFHVGYSSWLRYDDATVKPVLEEQVLKPQGTRVPYLLFYRRSDTIRSR